MVWLKSHLKKMIWLVAILWSNSSSVVCLFVCPYMRDKSCKLKSVARILLDEPSSYTSIVPSGLHELSGVFNS